MRSKPCEEQLPRKTLDKALICTETSHFKLLVLGHNESLKLQEAFMQFPTLGLELWVGIKAWNYPVLLRTAQKLLPV